MQNAADTGSLTLERFEPLLAHTQAPDAMRTLIAAYLDAWEKAAPPARTDLNFRTLAPYMPTSPSWNGVMAGISIAWWGLKWSSA